MHMMIMMLHTLNVMCLAFAEIVSMLFCLRGYVFHTATVSSGKKRYVSETSLKSLRPDVILD